MPLRSATSSDIPHLVSLINSAYRGEASRKGWTTEADLLEGDLRTDEKDLGELLSVPGAMMLVHINDAGLINACVFLQVKPRGLYLGMLSVSPELQASGLGKQLMAAAETVAKENGCTSIYMTVISVRHELIGWYGRRGYRLTGEREPWQVETRFGKPRSDFDFVVMEKRL